MAKVLILDKKMTEKDIREYGAEVKMFNGSIYEIWGADCIHTKFKTQRPLSQCYKAIRNVKDREGKIIGKRRHPGNGLYFTSAAIKPLKQERPMFTPPKAPRKSRKPMRNINKCGRAKKVSVFLHETGYTDLQEIKRILLERGARQVDVYRTKKGIALVTRPDNVLKEFISEKE
ncbi:hypothetical protein [Bacillus sp. FSL H8-0515]|uniref:hypothetical protein n=1 Tax=Bacillus sp. FSL H8-0515 TaxID=2921396 RepID=UPI0030FAFF77